MNAFTSNTVEATLASTMSAAPSITRGDYDEIVSCKSVLGMGSAEIIKRFAEALPETFVDFDKKARGDALNLDLYGYDPNQNVAVIQIRHAFRRYKNGFLNVHKDYVLVGFNEITGQSFRHPVSAAAIRAAIRKAPLNPSAAVRGAQKWMWGVTDKQLDASLAAGMRQGDVLLVKERTPAESNVHEDHGTVATIGESHEIRAQRIVTLWSDRVFALAPSLWHSKGQHAATFADDDSWYSVRVAETAETWKWGVRLGD
jgi:hypothetical protein